MSKKIEYKIGEILGDLEYVSDIQIYKIKGKSIRDGMFKCKCGNIFKARIYHVKKRNIVSCKCKQKETIRAVNLTHGCSHGVNKTKEYYCWINMKTRCYNKNNKEYFDYGGRGILVCDRWVNSFEYFLKDSGLAPSKSHSIERVDNNGIYCKNNCIWATKKEQANNRRSVKLFSFNGVLKNLDEWAFEYNMKRKTLWKRITKFGWSVEDALTIPTNNTAKNKRERFKNQKS